MPKEIKYLIDEMYRNEEGDFIHDFESNSCRCYYCLVRKEKALKEKRALIVDYMMDKLYFKYVAEWKQLYIYDEETGIYEDYAEDYIQEFVYSLKFSFENKDKDEIIARIKWRNTIDKKFVNVFPYLAVENGIINLKEVINNWEVELLDFSPQYVFTKKLPVKYEPEADTEYCLDWLNERMAGNHGNHVQTLIELLGFCLYPEYTFKKAFVLVGENDTGKSTFLRIIESLLGKRNCSFRTLQDLETDFFARADLLQKLVNLSPDMPSKPIEDTGMFKYITGGDTFTARFIYGKPFDFRNYAKLIYSGNSLPITKYDSSKAFFSRWIIIVFSNTFAGEADPSIRDRLITSPEINGWLNLALMGLVGLYNRNEFSQDEEEINCMQDEWDRWADPLEYMIKNEIKWEPDSWIWKSVFRQKYRDLCEKYDKPFSGDKRIKERLLYHFPDIEESRRGGRGSSKRAWVGITWIDTTSIFDYNIGNHSIHSIHSNHSKKSTIVSIEKELSTKGGYQIFDDIIMCLNESDDLSLSMSEVCKRLSQDYSGVKVMETIEEMLKKGVLSYHDGGMIFVN